MTRDEFWAIIDRAREVDPDVSAVAEHVKADLATRTPEVIYAYLEHQGRLNEESYTWPLWGAAYIVNGGCSDDGFDYFRGWLFAQGRAAFERVVADPDSLADVATEGEEVEIDFTDQVEMVVSAKSFAEPGSPTRRAIHTLAIPPRFMRRMIS